MLSSMGLICLSHVSEVLNDRSQSGSIQFAIRVRDDVEAKEPEKVGDEKDEEEEEKEARESSGKEKQTASNGSVKQLDPLRWFGILVPPALRTAQSTFTTTVQGPMARAVTLAMDLRSQEIEIGRMRKQIKKL